MFAAQWSHSQHKISNQNIVDAIWETYEALEQEGFILEVIEEASDRNVQREREYTLFEYLFGLGRYLPKQYKTLFKPSDVNKPSSAGFNLVAACLKLRLRDIGGMPDILKNLNADMDTLEHQILEATQFVENTLKPIFSVKQAKQSKLPIYHSEYQIVSMIATVFNVKYDVSSESEKPGWRSVRDELEIHLRMHYLYDILREYWRSAGDSKLFEVVRRLTYVSSKPSKHAWAQVLDDWFLNNQMKMLHSGRYVKQGSPEILLLKYIYTHLLSVMDNSQEFHIEHIVPVNKLTASKAKEEKWPINAVGNLAILEKADNLKKGDHTFKEYLDTLLNKERVDEDEYRSKLKEYEERLICEAEILPSQISLESYKEFLMRRFDFLKVKFFSVWQSNLEGQGIEP